MIGISLLQTIKSGDSPDPLSSFTLACVGLVFDSPVDFGCMHTNHGNQTNENGGIKNKFTYLGYKRNMNTAKAFMTNSKLELSESLNKRHSFNISNSSSKFNDTHFWFLSIISNRDFGNTFYPILNCICYVRDDYKSRNFSLNELKLISRIF